MSSHNVSSAVTYTTISSDSDRPSRGIPLMNAGELPEMDPYEEIEDQHYAADASPLTLSLGYIAESDQKEILEEDSKEDPIDYAVDTNDNEEDEEEEESSDDEEEEEEEEHLAPAVALSAVDFVPSAKETEPFETDESAATPPPPPAYRTTSKMFEIGESSTTAARQPRSNMARRVDYGFVAGVHRWESAEFQTCHQDVKDDRAALCDEVDTLRRYLSSLCTTHEQERVEACQALDRSEAHIRALEARIAVLEVEPLTSFLKTLRLLYRSSKLRLSTPGLVVMIKET
ncbi:hypothetical protein Tco_1403113 [Tanacetum coccineum]